MKLVITYTQTDGDTYWCQVDDPFEYESVESAELEFLRLWEETKATNKDYKFVFAGYEYWVADFMSLGKYVEPKIRTLDQWFEEEKPE